MSPEKKADRKTGDKNPIKAVKERLKGDADGRKKGPQKDPSRTIAMWFIVAVAVVLGLRFLNDRSGLRETRLSYSQFRALLTRPGSVRSIQVLQKGMNRNEVRGEVIDPSILADIPGAPAIPGNRNFTVNLPLVDSRMLAEWDSLGFEYSFETKEIGFWDILLSSWPVLILILFWIFMFRQMQGGQRGIFAFGKSRAKLHAMNRPKNSFADVAGVEEAKADLEEIIDFLKDPKKYRRLGGKIPKGVLLLGPPGTGKTLLARAVAGEAGVPFLSMSGSDFVEMFVGVGASRVRDLFDTAKKHSPSIIFIDEIDAVGRQRGAGLGGGHDEREQTLNQMLVEMDGFEENSGVILVAATNRPDVLDPALLRPGRFDRQIVVDVPDIRGREGILKVHVKDIPLAPDVDLFTVARGTPGFVGADLANLVNEAALTAARFDQQQVTMLDFEEAKDRVLMGPERRSMVLSPDEKRTTAFHEAGHAVCNIYCTNADPLHKVTIIPRGRALGVTFSMPEEDRHSQTREYILDKICILMGGRVAEEMAFGVQTTGAANDISNATDLIRRVICDFGMSEQLGPLSYGKKEEQIFLGREIATHRDYSDKTAEEIDRLMRTMIDEQLGRARTILTEHRGELDCLAEALLEHEMLDLEEIRKVIGGDVLESTKKTRSVLPRSPAPKEGEQGSAEKGESRDQAQDAGGADTSSSDQGDATPAGS